ncbi:MAG: TM2 domain-containing protein, partial [Bacteroidota bacterium]
MKDKNVAGILALFFGWLGMHRFYLGQVGLGIFFAFLTIVSQGEALPLVMFFSVIDAIVFFSQDKDKFDLKYNKAYFKKVRKERPDFDRNKKRYDNRQQRTVNRNAERKDRTVNRKPRHNPYKASGIEKYKDYDYGGAIEDFAKALEIDERDIATHFNIACAYSINENVERAFYHLDRAVG